MTLLKSPGLDRCVALQTSPAPGQPHAVPLPNTAKEGRTAVYRNYQFTERLLDTLDPKIVTAHDFFEAAANGVPNNKCLGHRPYDPITKTFGQYQWETYQQIQRRRRNLGVGLVLLHKEIGITGKGYGVGLWCQNRPEWQITDLACQTQSLFSVSLYDTLGPDATEYIISHADLACVVVSLNHIPALLKLKPRLPKLKYIVSMDPLNEGERPGESKGEILNALGEELGVTILSIQDVEALGEADPMPYNPPSPEDTITINYTSGTTGNPKGVVLTHANAVAACSAALIAIKRTPDDIVLSFLPLAHIFQRNNEHCALWAGTAIAYFHGDIQGLLEDLKMVRPTAFVAVPRLFTRFGSGLKAATLEAPGVRGALSRHVVATKTAAMEAPNATVGANKHFFYDRIFCRKASAAVGLDRVGTVVSGSAPLDPSLQQYLRSIFSCNFLQGYGLTESYACSTFQLWCDFSVGNVGAVAPNTECCLESVPDMDYLVTDKPNPRGELLLRGSSLFREYFKNPEETAKSVDADGWFHTGDIAEIDSLGRVKIVDRKKNVLKLAQGEYISPERIENAYLANCIYLASAYVHGDSTESSLVAIFGISPDAFAPFVSKVLGKEHSMADTTALLEAANHPKVRRAVVKDLEKVGKQSKFNNYEKVKAVKLMLDPFTVENELLTPTLKLKRPQSAKKYRAELDQLYAEVAASQTTKAKL